MPKARPNCQHEFNNRLLQRLATLRFIRWGICFRIVRFRLKNSHWEFPHRNKSTVWSGSEWLLSSQSNSRTVATVFVPQCGIYTVTNSANLREFHSYAFAIISAFHSNHLTPSFHLSVCLMVFFAFDLFAVYLVNSRRALICDAYRVRLRGFKVWDSQCKVHNVKFTM